MYITCKQCDTIFRLDESLVKPTGSKARCCQCRNVFVIYPLEPEKIETDAVAMQAVPQAVSEAAIDQELEGIDLAELDSILEQDQGLEEEIPVSAAAEQDTVVDDVVAELDESDLDLDFTIEPEDQKQQPEQTQEAAMDMGIDDLDFDMDFELDDGLGDKGVAAVDESDIEATSIEAPEASVPPTEEELEMELDQLDLSLDEDEPAIEAPAAVEEAALDDLDLTGADLALEEDEPEAAAPEIEDQELELSLDDEQPSPKLASEKAAVAEPEEALDDLDLSDLDAVLGLDEESDQVPLDLPESTGGDDFELSLDDDTETAADELPGLELDEEPVLDLDAEPALELDEEPVLDLDAEPALELDEEPVLDLDEEPVLELDDESDSGAQEELELEMAPADDIDDLDLSDLDAMLSDAPEGSESALETDEALDLELELDDDSALTETPGDELEDLSFELDSEFEDEPVLEEPKEEAVAASDDEEIDLSDIEQMLEGDDTAATLGLTKEPVETEEGEVELGDDDEIDLTEIEAAIDAADKQAGEDTSFEEELSLDDVGTEPTLEMESKTEPEMEIELDDLALELESDASTVEVEPITAADDSDELDLSDLGELVEEKDASATTDTIDSGEIELEFEVSDEPIEEAVAISQTAGVETADLESTIPVEEKTMPAQVAMEAVEEEAAPVKKKKRSGKGLLFLLILLLLGGAGYLFYAVSYMGVEIPYLSEYLNPKPKDPAGVLNLATLDINSKFIENETSGRLFVVTGKVRNGKDTARRMIRLQGKLFTKGKVLAKTEFTYGGVSLKDQEISQQAIADIKKKINSPSGPAAAVKVLPGQTVPFMIVFSDLPEGLDEFAIEVISSMQAQ
ncbi:MAG: DUF3426 domain-containing protein [Desulfobacteraceae bacterium]|jgi:predicted Zn finger-like uncharacterized protein